MTNETTESVDLQGSISDGGLSARIAAHTASSPTHRTGKGEATYREPSVSMKSEPVKFNEWSLPLKIIIKQKNFQYGKDFKKEEKIDVYLSQNTVYPGPDGQKDEQIHSTMR